MRKSRAYRQFTDLLGTSEALLKMEAKIPIPVPANRLKQSNGLKGGSIVLMVAAFETYLQESFAQYAERLNGKQERIDITILDDSIWQHNVSGSLEMATKRSP